MKEKKTIVIKAAITIEEMVTLSPLTDIIARFGVAFGSEASDVVR